MKLLQKKVLQSFTKRKAKLELFILALATLLSGCSWQEYFIIVNETNFPTTINYSLSDTGNGFGMFDKEPSIYPLNPTGDIDWSNKLSIADADSSQTGISLTLPAKCTLVMGSLMNDRYENHTQNAVNEHINVRNITIIHPEKTFEITSENFADFFRKRNNNIEYRINSTTLN